jgi:hypothetical protein
MSDPLYFTIQSEAKIVFVFVLYGGRHQYPKITSMSCSEVSRFILLICIENECGMVVTSLVPREPHNTKKWNDITKYFSADRVFHLATENLFREVSGHHHECSTLPSSINLNNSIHD